LTLVATEPEVRVALVSLAEKF